MRIALDVMGGDYAPKATLEGALTALDSSIIGPDDQLILIGDQAAIESHLADRKVDDSRISIIGSSNDITMSDTPVDAVRTKTESSIVKMAGLAGRKQSDPVDLIISAGNTGACVSAAQMLLRRLPHVHRPGVAVTIPAFSGPLVVCDVGANPAPKAHHLWQYGLMAEMYAREVHGIERPRVAVLNIGGEEAKGTEMVKQTASLFRRTPGIDYVGFVEGRALFEGEADVVVTDGFVGNVVLKLSEGLATGLFRTIMMELAQVSPELQQEFKPIIKNIWARHDYHEFGGAPLLGVNGTCVICHGSSEARTITSAIRAGISMVQHELNDHIVKRLAELEEVGVG